jgi:hypothetical protein
LFLLPGRRSGRRGGWTGVSNESWICPLSGLYLLSYSLTAQIVHIDASTSGGLISSIYIGGGPGAGSTTTLGFSTNPTGMSVGTYYPTAATIQHLLTAGESISLQLINFTTGNYTWSIQNPTLSAMFVHS